MDILTENDLNQLIKITEDYFQKFQKDAASKYRELVHTESTSNDVKKVIEAASAGRVDTLFVARDKWVWGCCDPETFSTEIHDERLPDDEDLLDLAAVKTLSNGGTVYAVEQEKMPDETTLAAIFRF